MKKMNNILKLTLFLFILVVPVLVSQAQLIDPTVLNLDEKSNEFKVGAGFQDADIETVSIIVIKTALGFLGLIFLVLTIMAGFKWMNAGGNDEDVKKAQTSVKNATIGLIVVLAAYTMTVFVFERLPLANGLDESTSQVATGAGLVSMGVGGLVATIIGVILSFLALIFLVLTIMAGFKWMTAGGNDEEVKKAQTSLKNAVIGLVIVLASYAITYFIFNSLPFSGGESSMTELT
ncbi:hypothetical protein GW758_00740 [Candidatus Falkowbacteria bacterium]|nr:hypothetical protein [Candidatus Falkowbacteria bacterium]NCT54470.1 hypothetical protein [Candidatus Falkowbacteria bacterium]